MATSTTSSESGTLPPGGHVSRLRANWSVHEDGALAQRLQSQEIDQHLSGNRQRNHQIREDLPRARQEQFHEVEQATKQVEERRRQLRDIEARDAEVARQVQTRLFSSSTPPLPVMSNGDVPDMNPDVLPGRRRIVYNDEQYLVKLARPALVKDEPVYANNKPEHYAVSSKYPGDSSSSKYPPGGAISKIPAASPRRNIPYEHDNSDSDNVVGLAGLSQRDLVLSKRAEEQLEQQKRDEELAKRLQEQLLVEETEDARFAREAQDLEYAKMLHAKEKAKLKRAKERSRQKKLLQQQQQDQPEDREQLELLGAAAARVDSRMSKKSNSTHHDSPQRSFDENHEESVIELPARRPFMNTNAIDRHKSEFAFEPNHDEVEDDDDEEPESEVLTEPQYANVGPNAGQYMSEPRHVRQVSNDGFPVPPYMPMQQPMSKKSSSLEKKIKRKKEKEGCKQQ